MESRQVISSRQRKVDARKTRSSQKWKKPYHERRNTIDAQRSRDENRRLRKVARSDLQRKKHLESYARTRALDNPLSYDGFLGSEADVLFQNTIDVVGWKAEIKIKEGKKVVTREFVHDELLPPLNEDDGCYYPKSGNNESWFLAVETNFENYYETSL